MVDLLWPPENVAILGAGQTYSGGVDDGHEGLDVLHQEPIEESLVSLLDPHQIDVPEQTDIVIWMEFTKCYPKEILMVLKHKLRMNVEHHILY